MRSRFVALLFSAALAICACGSSDDAAPRPARIILFSMDTVRAGSVSGYGSAATTPRLAEIAAEGSLFERFYAASSFTIPSHMSIFTGLDPAEHGVYGLQTRLAPEVLTLAERLAGAGYQTQAFHEDAYVAARFGFDDGFAAYVELPRVGLVKQGLPRVLAWMNEQGDRPYFLFLHTYAAHVPYGGYERYRAEHPERGLPERSELRQLPGSDPRSNPPGARLPAAQRLLCSVANQFAEGPADVLPCGSRRLPPAFTNSPHFDLDRAAMLRSYEQRIALVDRAIGAIRDDLVARGQWDDTLLIVTADHGEAFYEHGGLWGHGYVPFDEVLHVPLVISYPRFLREAGVRVVSDLAWHLDLFPTVLGFAHESVPQELRGRDLRDSMRGAHALPRDAAVFPTVLRSAHLPPVPLRRVALSESFKWIEGHEIFGAEQNLLFDLAADPTERRNLCQTDAEACRRLEASARAWEHGLRPQAPVQQRTGARTPPTGRGASEPADVSHDEQEKLRALGYVE